VPVNVTTARISARADAPIFAKARLAEVIAPAPIVKGVELPTWVSLEL